MAKQVSVHYLDGIKEGRELLNDFPLIPARTEYENCRRLARNHSGAMKDFFRGQCDFWKNQMNK